MYQTNSGYPSMSQSMQYPTPTPSDSLGPPQRAQSVQNFSAQPGGYAPPQRAQSVVPMNYHTNSPYGPPQNDPYQTNQPPQHPQPTHNPYGPPQHAGSVIPNYGVPYSSPMQNPSQPNY
jgi:hypothetical protein